MNDNTSNINNNQAFTEEQSGMTKATVIMWITRFLKRWYLFVISIAVFMTLAYLKNRSWQPFYKSNAMMIIQSGRGYSYGQNQLLGGFSLERAFSDVNNQIVMFASHDLLKRVVEANPEFTIDYYTQGRFKRNNLYKRSPISITRNYVSDAAYGREFAIRDIDGERYEITSEGNDRIQAFADTGSYGKAMQNSMFFIEVAKTTAYMPGYDIKFMLYRTESKVDAYSAGLVIDFAMKGSSVVNVSLMGNVPERDCDFLNTLCEMFVDDNLNRKNDAAVRTIEFIDSQLEHMTDSLENSERRLQDFKSANFDIANMGTSSLYSAYSKLENILSDIRLQEAYLTYLTDYLRNNVDDGAIIAPTNLGVKDNTLSQLVLQYSELQLKMEEVGEKSPIYERYARELSSVKQRMNETLKNLQISLDIQKNDLQAQMLDVTKGLQELPYKQQQFSNIERVFKLNDNYYSFLVQKRADAQIQKASNTSDNIFLEKARVQMITNFGDKSKTYSSNLLIALVIPICVVVLIEVLNPFVRSEAELLSIADGYGVWGTLRHTKEHDTVVVEKFPKSSVTETFRVLRTKVEYMVQRKENISVAVSSTESGDGKTYLSSNLAAVFALQKKPTLLIDLDMRKPSVSKLLDLKRQKGLSSLLAGDEDVTLDSAIQKNPGGHKFDVLPVGYVPPDPGELIRSERMLEIFEELKKRYTYIVVDTSPIGLVADAYALVTASDCLLYAVRCGRTNKAFCKNTLKQLKSNGISNLGLVFNDVYINKMEYSTYYGSYGAYYGSRKRNNNYYYAAAKKRSENYFDEKEENKI